MGSSPKKAARRKGTPTNAPVRPKGPGSTPGKAAPAGTGAPMDPLAKTAWYCLHLLVILVPLAMSNLTWTGISQLPLTYDQFDIAKVFVMRAITLVAYAALGWRLLVKGGKWRRSPMDWAVVAFLGWVLLTTVLSIHWPTAVFGKYRRFEGLISFVNYAAVFFLAVQFVDRPSRIRSLARTIFAGAVVVAGYGAMQVVGIDPINWGANLPFEANRAFSTYGNPDLLGGYLVLVLPLGLALALEESDTWRRAMYWLGFLLVTFTWISSFVRGAWIGGAAALVVIVFAIVWRRERLGVVDYSFLGLLGLMAAGVVLSSLTAESPVMNVVERLKGILDFSSGSGLTRTQIWEAAISAVKDRPIFGFGADTFRLLFPKYKPVEYVTSAGYLSVADNVHSYPLQVMTAFGIPGFLFLYGLFGFSLVKSAKTAFVREKGGERLLLAGLWAGAAGYLVHLLAGLSVTGSTLILWIFLGVLLAPLARVVEVRAPAWGLYAAVALLVVVGAAFVGNVLYIVADSYYLSARVAADPIEQRRDIETAIRLNPYNDMYRAELGLAYQSEFIQALNAMSQVRASGGDPKPYAEQAVAAAVDAERAMLDTIEYVPWEYDNYVFLANLDNLAADNGLGEEWRTKAIEVAKRGMEVEPFGPAIRLQLAAAYYGQGKLELAISTMEEAIAMDPRYVEGNLALGQWYREAGETDGAWAAYKRVLEANPDQSTYDTAFESLKAIEASATTK